MGNQNIGRNIATLRKNNHLSQEEFGRKLGVRRSTIAGYENMERTPNIRSLILIADTYNVTLDELIKGVIKEE
jgi:transcriptional regulator with XRE-family HTH domain